MAAKFELTDLTGEEYDEVETIVGKELDGKGGVSGVRLTRAMGFVLAKRADPTLTWPEFNKRPVADQMAYVKDSEDDAGKASGN